MSLSYLNRNYAALHVQWPIEYNIHSPLVVLGDGITRFTLHVLRAKEL